MGCRTMVRLEASSTLLVFFLPVHFYASTSADIKKALMLCIKAFPCRHPGEKVEEINE